MKKYYEAIARERTIDNVIEFSIFDRKNPNPISQQFCLYLQEPAQVAYELVKYHITNYPTEKKISVISIEPLCSTVEIDEKQGFTQRSLDKDEMSNLIEYIIATLKSRQFKK